MAFIELKPSKSGRGKKSDKFEGGLRIYAI